MNRHYPNGCAIVVGASSGIGNAIARRLIDDGWTVGVAARRTDMLADLVALDHHRVCAARIDVTDAAAPLQLAELAEKIGGMNLYVHVAGIGKQNYQLDANIELSTVATNADGFCRLVGAAFRNMEAHGGGQIVAVSSVAGTKGMGAAPAYSATKALQNTYLESLAQLSAMRRLGIAITDIRPGFVATDLIAGSNYPMTMTVDAVAREAVRAIYRRRAVAVIDWRWRIMTSLWRLLPHRLWRRMAVGKPPGK